MNLRSRLLTHLLLVFVALQACASKPVTLESDDSSIIKNYLAIHEQFVKDNCPPGITEEHQKLLKAFRGTGYYIPEKSDNI